MSKFDTIVIGAGHNGIVCATQLARAGRKVLIVEASDRIGGLASQREFHPGFSASVAQSLYAVPKKIVAELSLEKHGFDPHSDPLPTTALGGECPIEIGDETLSGASASDVAAFRVYRQQLKRFSAALAPFWSKTIPGIGGNSLREILTFAHMGVQLRLLGKDDMLEFLRVASLPMRDLVDERFESEALKAALCWDGLIGSRLAPRSPNQAVLTLLNRMAGANDGMHTLPRGGVAAFVGALRSAAESFGVELRTGAAVRRLLIEADEQGQRCSGVELHSGETLHASAVVSSADPQTTFLRLLGAEHLEIEFGNRIRRLRCDGHVGKLHLALRALPDFPGVARPDGRMIIAPTMDAIEFAYDDAKYGNCSAEPVMEVLIPSLRNPSLAPPGQHVLAAQVMYLPARRKGGWTAEAKAEVLRTLMASLEAHAPGIGALTLHAELLTPADLESMYGLTNGAWHHVEPAIDQLLMMRPTYEAAQYRTPIDGLFLCGAGSHPGGDLSGNPGRNAAREILA